MSEIELQAAYISAPHRDAIFVRPLTVVSQVFDLVAELGPKVDAGRYISIVGETGDIYYHLNNVAGAVDKLATAGPTRCWYAPAGVEKHHVLRAGYTFLAVQGSAAGFVRAYISSINPHENTPA